MLLFAVELGPHWRYDSSVADCARVMVMLKSTTDERVERNARAKHRSASRAEIALLGVHEIAKALAAPLPLQRIASQVVNLLSSFLEMDRGLIALLREDGELEHAAGSYCDSETAMRDFEWLPERVVGRIVTLRMPLFVENIREHPLFADVDVEGGRESLDPDDNVSFIGVPIKDAVDVRGILCIDRRWKPHDRGKYCFDDDVRFLTMVGSMIGQTARLHAALARDRERLLVERNRFEKAAAGMNAPEAGALSSEIVGESRAIRAVLEQVRRVASTHSTVLLRGESGTGKELFARALHDLSPRRKRPFVSLNCAALPESILDSELFGHEKGAFTGATTQRKGRFELADKGTLFLDEIGEISASFQAKLLRVLQLGEFERVGGTQTLSVDVRLIAATNRNLEEAVARGEFRADLYYRISVVPIVLPPLRERVEDIPLLAHEFLDRFNAENGRSLTFDEETLRTLAHCAFPGNVRELENCVRRTATLARGPRIQRVDLACDRGECLSTMLWRPLETAAPAGDRERLVSRSVHTSPVVSSWVSFDEPSADVVPDSGLRGERSRLIETMESVGWVQAKAARVLGLTPRQVGYALRKHRIPIKKI